MEIERPIEHIEMMAEKAPSMVTAMAPEGVEYDDSGPDLMVVDEDYDEDEAHRAEILDLPFDANLADYLDDSELTGIGSDLVEKVGFDLTNRKEWEFLIAKAIEELNLGDNQPTPEFDGASTASFPLLLQSMVQFNARVMDELFPPTGPVKTTVVGEKSESMRASSRRVEDHMNYQITAESIGWYAEDDRMTWNLALTGQTFKKVYFDAKSGRNVSKFIKGKDLIVPYDTIDLDTTPRITERHFQSESKINALVAQRLYRDLELTEGHGDLTDDDQIRTAENSSEGTGDTSAEDEGPRVIYEVHTDLSLEGVLDSEDGLPVPYKVYVDKETEQVLGVYRNWDPKSTSVDKFARDETYVDFTFIPGFGFYGMGLAHLVGHLGSAVNELLRTFINGAMFASANGGFVSRDAFPKGASISMKPGVYEPTDKTAEELSKAFYTPAFKPPSVALQSAIEMMVDTVKEFTATTEAMTGNAGASGPVGTMVALIEQGSKVFSGIHKRMHHSKRREYNILAKLNGRHMPPEGYPYRVVGLENGQESFSIYAEDYSPAIDILPVSDPNITSPQQRIAMAQATQEMAQADPQSFDVYEANRRLLEALRIPDIDGILKPRGGTDKLYDPSIENSMLAMGQVPRVGAEQAHDAHSMVHEAFLQSPILMEMQSTNPEQAEMVMMSVQGHILEHKLHSYRQQMMQQMQQQLPPMALGESPEDISEELPPEAEAQISQQMAQISQQMMEEQQANQPEPPPSPEEMEAQALQEKHQAEMGRKQEAHQAEMGRKQEVHQLTMQQDQEKKGMALQQDQEQSAIDMQQDIEKHNIELGQDAEKHGQEMNQDAEEHNQEMIQKDEEHAQDMQQGAAEGRQKLQEAEQTTRIKNKQAAADAARPKPKPEGDS